VKSWGKRVLLGLVAVVATFGLLQLVPYRVSNGKVTAEPKWDSPRTRELVVAACYDCHSNQTRTPWYGKIAPVSWWLTNHVKDGRAAVNFSTWDQPQGEGARDLARSVQSGSMPPSYYTWFGLHSNAKLTNAQRAELVAGLIKTFGASTRGG
jgi:hypothetical protein